MSFMTRCEGDPDFKRALNMVAAGQGISVSKLVRQAIEATYGPEITHARSFFDSTAYNGMQKGTDGRKKKGNK